MRASKARRNAVSDNNNLPYKSNRKGPVLDDDLPDDLEFDENMSEAQIEEKRRETLRKHKHYLNDHGYSKKIDKMTRFFWNGASREEPVKKDDKKKLVVEDLLGKRIAEMQATIPAFRSATLVNFSKSEAPVKDSNGNVGDNVVMDYDYEAQFERDMQMAINLSKQDTQNDVQMQEDFKMDKNNMTVEKYSDEHNYENTDNNDTPMDYNYETEFERDLKMEMKQVAKNPHVNNSKSEAPVQDNNGNGEDVMEEMENDEQEDDDVSMDRDYEAEFERNLQMAIKLSMQSTKNDVEMQDNNINSNDNQDVITHQGNEDISYKPVITAEDYGGPLAAGWEDKDAKDFSSFDLTALYEYHWGTRGELSSERSRPMHKRYDMGKFNLLTLLTKKEKNSEEKERRRKIKLPLITENPFKDCKSTYFKEHRERINAIANEFKLNSQKPAVIPLPKPQEPEDESDAMDVDVFETEEQRLANLRAKAHAEKELQAKFDHYMKSQTVLEESHFAQETEDERGARLVAEAQEKEKMEPVLGASVQCKSLFSPKKITASNGLDRLRAAARMKPKLEPKFDVVSDHFMKSQTALEEANVVPETEDERIARLRAEARKRREMEPVFDASIHCKSLFDWPTAEEKESEAVLEEFNVAQETEEELIDRLVAESKEEGNLEQVLDAAVPCKSLFSPEKNNQSNGLDRLRNADRTKPKLEPSYDAASDHYMKSETVMEESNVAQVKENERIATLVAEAQEKGSMEPVLGASVPCKSLFSPKKIPDSDELARSRAAADTKAELGPNFDAVFDSFLTSILETEDERSAMLRAEARKRIICDWPFAQEKSTSEPLPKKIKLSNDKSYVAGTSFSLQDFDFFCNFNIFTTSTTSAQENCEGSDDMYFVFPSP